MSSQHIVVGPLRDADLDRVTRIHIAAFRTSALTQLGAGAVRRYYVWQLTGPHDVVALGAWLDGELRGYCFGGVFRGATSGFVRRNRGFLVGCVLCRPWLVLSAGVSRRMMDSLRLLRPSKRTAAPTPKETAQGKPFGILAIAVDPDYQGHGIGRVLMERSEAAAREAGFTQLHLTVHPDNEQPIGFYERPGFRKVHEGGGWRGLMRKDLRHCEA